MAISNTRIAKLLETLLSPGYAIEVIPIGDWNMSSVASVNIPHGLDFTKIRSIDVIIRCDSDVEPLTYYQFIRYDSAGTSKASIRLTDANIILARSADGKFHQTTDFNDLDYNRGWATIIYET